MEPINFEQLRRLPVVTEYTQAVQAATACRLYLLNPRLKSDARRCSSCAFRVPVMVDGHHVATLACEAPRVSRDRMAGVKQLVDLIVKQIARQADQYLIISHKDDPPAVVRAKEYVQSHPGENLNTAKMAHQVHLSADHFSRIFKKATGLSFHDYVTRVRLEKVKRLLTNPTMRINEAAFAVGFESLPYFNREFKRLTGLSPTDYRRSISLRRISTVET